ncbi:MAG: ATP-binding protein [Leptolyngbyaceae cyanobacterium SM1_3_5]|nr:ATP-binding protein [Leptolyngbyaceae cyanobacterium SM1_3_5]
MQQILLNLLSNAIKFTPAGGRVTLRLFADERMVMLQVQDTRHWHCRNAKVAAVSQISAA